MRITKNSKLQSIEAATSYGTKFYRTTIDETIDALKQSNSNIWVIYMLESEGWNAIDFDNNLFGSKVIDDELFICETDGQDIQVNGHFIDPEKALEEYDVSELSAYIQPADKDKIAKSITGYEVKISDVDKVAIELLDNGYSFTDVVKDAEELELLD